MSELALFLSGDTGVEGILSVSSAEGSGVICCPRHPQISSAKCARLFAFKNTGRLVKDHLLVVLTSRPKHRAVSSRAQA